MNDRQPPLPGRERDPWYDTILGRWLDHRHPRHPHHHRPKLSPPSAPTLRGITLTLKDPHMPAIPGNTVQTVTLTLTLPTTRKDGTVLSLQEIATATILRDSGSGPIPLTTLSGPFSSGTATGTDPSPATGSDTYSFFVTDTAGTQGDTSPPVSVTGVGVVTLAAPSAGTLTATVNTSTAPAPSVITVSPAVATITTGATNSFSASISPALIPAPTVTWSAVSGSIDQSGNYTAPTTPGSDTVTATATGATSGTASITILAP